MLSMRVRHEKAPHGRGWEAAPCADLFLLVCVSEGVSDFYFASPSPLDSDSPTGRLPGNNTQEIVGVMRANLDGIAAGCSFAKAYFNVEIGFAVCVDLDAVFVNGLCVANTVG